MVKEAHKPVLDDGHWGSLDDDDRRLASARLVNHGRDTKLTFSDGSTLVLMGVKEVEAVFGSAAKRAPVDGDIDDDC
jgi:hypothetical protein